ncbi:uncharacterized protein EV420DRAFT_1279905, partial [Desarmillaria tabescens]
GVSAIMQEFQPEFDRILEYMLASEGDSSIGDPCACNRDDAVRLYMCHDCQHYEPSCRQCFLDFHGGRNPWHWAEEWNGTHFVRRDIAELGHVVTIGHDRHSSPHCHYALEYTPIDFTLVHINGVHQTWVVFCQCPGKPGNHFQNLLESRIFPATRNKPRTGFTFAVLRDFHLHTLTSKKSSYDYIEAVKRQGNNAFPQDCPDVYRQFVRVQRIWIALTMKKRSRQAHGIDKHFPQCPAGFVVVPCFACPEWGFNVSDLIMDTVSEKMIHLVQFTFMQDGHFGLQRFRKVDDPDDISIVTGTGLFPMDKAYNEYIEKVVATSDEVGILRAKSTCSQFNAIEMQNKMKFKGCVITGVIAVECGRHCIFISMVDLHKGEW